MDAWLLQLSAQAIESLFCMDSSIQRKMIEKRRWGPAGGHVGKLEEVCVGDRGGGWPSGLRLPGNSGNLRVDRFRVG